VLAISVANLTSLVGFDDEEQDAKAVPP
jgi:hypothetical protein